MVIDSTSQGNKNIHFFRFHFESKDLSGAFLKEGEKVIRMDSDTKHPLVWFDFESSLQDSAPPTKEGAIELVRVLDTIYYFRERFQGYGYSNDTIQEGVWAVRNSFPYFLGFVDLEFSECGEAMFQRSIKGKLFPEELKYSLPTRTLVALSPDTKWGGVLDRLAWTLSFWRRSPNMDTERNDSLYIELSEVFPKPIGGKGATCLTATNDGVFITSGPSSKFFPYDASQ